MNSGVIYLSDNFKRSLQILSRLAGFLCQQRKTADRITRVKNPTTRVRRSWEDLRDQYRREIKRETREGIKSRWIFYDKMAFVRPNLRLRNADGVESDAESLEEVPESNHSSNDVSPIFSEVIAAKLVENLQVQLPSSTKLTVIPAKTNPNGNEAWKKELHKVLCMENGEMWTRSHEIYDRIKRKYENVNKDASILEADNFKIVDEQISPNAVATVDDTFKIELGSDVMLSDNEENLTSELPTIVNTTSSLLNIGNVVTLDNANNKNRSSSCSPDEKQQQIASRVKDSTTKLPQKNWVTARNSPVKAFKPLSERALCSRAELDSRKTMSSPPETAKLSCFGSPESTKTAYNPLNYLENLKKLSNSMDRLNTVGPNNLTQNNSSTTAFGASMMFPKGFVQVQNMVSQTIQTNTNTSETTQENCQQTLHQAAMEGEIVNQTETKQSEHNRKNFEKTQLCSCCLKNQVSKAVEICTQTEFSYLDSLPQTSPSADVEPFQPSPKRSRMKFSVLKNSSTVCTQTEEHPQCNNFKRDMNIDEYFLNSLLPLIRELNSTQKLEFQYVVMETLIKFKRMRED